MSRSSPAWTLSSRTAAFTRQVPSISAVHKTGVFFVEALHPYEVLTAAGFEVDPASETGTCGFDDASLMLPFLSGSDHAILNNPKHPFKERDLRCRELKQL